jgi:uracil-DNA glycosylase/DNA polymerase I-like protein with 3'-5' exonuclease and polymerase domains
MRKVLGHGPGSNGIMIVGEAPGVDEELHGLPFVGASGRLLDTMLREVGIDRKQCYVTNVVKYRPPGNDITAWLTAKKGVGVKNEWDLRDGRYFNELVQEGLDELHDEIARVQPRVIIGLGNAALWALAGEWGITNWRGSELTYESRDGRHIPFVPTIHPAAILRQWPLRVQVAHDLKTRVQRRLRAGFVGEPAFDFNWRPTFDEAYDFIMALEGDVAVDVETSRGQIVCVGLATSATRAMCIPFISDNYGAYWPANQVGFIKAALRTKLRDDPNVNVIGQNFIYDTGYFDACFGFVPRLGFDTLIAQTVLFPGTPRDLGYLASMYCSWYKFWKEDARDWQNLRDFDGLFQYNCRDTAYDWEIAQKQRGRLLERGLMTQFEDRMQYGRDHVYPMQQRGMIRDHDRTARLDGEIEESLHEKAIIVCDAAGRAINLASPKQIGDLVYKEWGCRKPARGAKAKTDGGGTGDEDLAQVMAWHPERADVLQAVVDWRSLKNSQTNILRAKLDPDGLLRGRFMPTGTETFRLTGGKNNFDRGTNLLNIPAPFRNVFVPPMGHTMFDCDLERADLQVVVWEADDADLKAKMRETIGGKSIDIHIENAKDIFGSSVPTDEQRQFAKRFVHLTDYGGKPRTCAIAIGSTVHEADMAQRRWFAAHPGILDWHKRTQRELETSRTVRNAFGYVMTFFDRVEGLLPQALAWGPQSTIAIVASMIHRAFDELGVQVVLQMYDSVVGYYPTVNEEIVLPLMERARKIVVPYDDPLIIPLGLSTSLESWGACKKGARPWPQ